MVISFKKIKLKLQIQQTHLSVFRKEIPNKARKSDLNKFYIRVY